MIRILKKLILLPILVALYIGGYVYCRVDEVLVLRQHWPAPNANSIGLPMIDLEQGKHPRFYQALEWIYTPLSATEASVRRTFGKVAD